MRADVGQLQLRFDADVYGVSDLNYYGNFMNLAGYGNVWQPFFMGSNWSPFQDGGWAIVDLGSSNGTFLRIREETEVGAGETLLMGQQLFRISLP